MPGYGYDKNSIRSEYLRVRGAVPYDKTALLRQTFQFLARTVVRIKSQLFHGSTVSVVNSFCEGRGNQPNPEPL